MYVKITLSPSLSLNIPITLSVNRSFCLRLYHSLSRALSHSIAYPLIMSDSVFPIHCLSSSIYLSLFNLPL